MADNGVAGELDVAGTLEGRLQPRQRPNHQRHQRRVPNVASRDRKQLRRPLAQEVAVSEVAVLRHHDPIVSISDSDQLGISRTVALGQITGVHDVMASTPKSFNETRRQLGVDQQSHAADVGTEERVLVTSAAYSSDASTSSRSRSG